MKYKLLKRLLNMSAWHIIDTDFLKNNPEIREEVKEREIKYPENLMDWWFIHADYGASKIDGKCVKVACREFVEFSYQMWNRFHTKEKAEAYLEIKKDVARFGKMWWIHLNYSPRAWWYRRDFVGSELDYCWQDFFLPFDSTEEEKENRAKLLKNYYWF
jgi:hypothetical protein